ncbi:YheC/YheD family protein [Paenibacillus turpanensis]|uniref:YheC/YheD family endospore coat-associated protein n=1 Tax=Paenibacillus turpanensis TaxID=2689078 RepID=UPI0014088EEB|nr:YheC/YheD family protein [Paenibacillus turpanensis]
MFKTKVTVHLQHTGMLQGDNIIMLSETLVKKWKLPANQSVTFRFGAYSTRAIIGTHSRPRTIRIGTAFAEDLGLTNGASLRLTYKPGTNTITAGPLIGVLMSRRYSSMPDKPFGSTTTYCKELTEASRQNGAFVYFFTPEQLEHFDTSVSGWIYTGGRWVQGRFPVPDVVYNRLTSRKLENKTSVQQFFKEVKSKHGTSIFNERYLDKTDVFAALKQDAALKHYLPESYLLKSFATMKSMCEKYKVVFLKPIRGSLGKGIIRVTRQEGGGVVAHYSASSGSIRKTFASSAKLFSSLAGKLKSQRYQIQQGIQLASVGGRPVDFRALVQKDENGKWSVTSIVARIAGNNQFVSNLARGGTISSAPAAIARMKLNGVTRNKALANLRKASLDIAEGIEENMEGHFGELGVDLGMDTRGRVWLIEVNSKPSKNDNTQLDENKTRPSVKQLLLYARYLSGL